MLFQWQISILLLPFAEYLPPILFCVRRYLILYVLINTELPELHQVCCACIFYLHRHLRLELLAECKPVFARHNLDRAEYNFCIRQSVAFLRSIAAVVEATAQINRCIFRWCRLPSALCVKAVLVYDPLFTNWL